MKFQPGDPKPANGGRKKGTPNKTTVWLKDAILEAAARAGEGDIAAYLDQQAKENPGPFLALLGKVLPLQVTGDRDKPVVITSVTYHIVDPKEPQHLTDQAMAKSRTRNVTGIVHWLSHGKLKDVWMADAASRNSIINKACHRSSGSA